MTRLKRFTALLISITLTAIASMACGPFITTPRDMVVYKLCDSPIAPQPDLTTRLTQASLQAWCDWAGGGITTGDVAQVMSRSVPQLESPDAQSGNAFERWLSHNPQAAEYLVLARQCELTRDRMSDPWWYPETDDDDLPTIEEVERYARSHSATEAQGRYTLLAVRAMVTQHKWQQCIDYWDSVQHQVACQAVRDLVEPNLVGCRFHLGDSAQALRRFLELGDVRSVQFCCKQMGLDWLDCARMSPELYVFQAQLDDYLRNLDHQLNNAEAYDWKDDTEFQALLDECRRRRAKCLTIAQQRPSNAAMWLYAAAAMSDALGDYALATQLCTQARHARGHQMLDERIDVLKFHIQVQSMAMGPGYDAMLQRGMRQLTTLTTRDIQQFREHLAYETAHWNLDNKESANYVYHNEANYYWHNMLYRIVAGEAAPRLVQAGKTTLALMATNVAENYLPRLMHADSLMQCYDNHTFTLADTLPTQAVKRYRQAVASPHNGFERWLVQLGYNDADYWNELLGTHCLRDMDYADAIAYLSQVSHAYQQSMNIWPYFKHDPMRHQIVRISDRTDYKLHYAQQMLAAQQAMRQSHDPNEQASAMMRLAIGLGNVADSEETDDDYGTWFTEGRDWALVRYGTGSASDFGQANHQALMRQLILSNSLKQKAFRTFTDKNLAASWCVELCQYVAAVTRYPDTPTAQWLRSHCDGLRDYKVGK